MEKQDMKWKKDKMKESKTLNYAMFPIPSFLHFIIPISLFFTFLILFSGCMRDPKPRNTLSKDKFINVLTDIHIAEALYQERKRINLDSLQSKEVYLSVLKKYNVTEEKMLATTLYYSRHPREYDKIYTEVVSRMERMIEETKEKTPKIEKPQ